MKTEEIWKIVQDYKKNYRTRPTPKKEISNLGRLKINGNISQPTNAKGYKVTSVDGKMIGIHRLVAINFIPNPDNKPFINHIDGIPSNNKVENLEGCTQAENVKHAWETGLSKGMFGEKNPNFIKQYAWLENKFWTSKELSEYLQVTKGTIDRWKRGERKCKYNIKFIK